MANFAIRLFLRFTTIHQEETMRYYLLALAALLALPATVWPQTDIDPYQMPELVVTATNGFTEAERNDPSHTVIIDQETIANSKAQTLADLLTEQGFQVMQGPNAYDQAYTYIRGYTSGQQENVTNGAVQFFINGRNAGTANARQLALTNVERVEIIRGPAIYKYTTASASGVINIITKRTVDRPIAGSLEVGYGSYDNFKTIFGANGKAFGVDYAMSYMYNKINDNYKDGDGKTVYDTKGGKVDAFNGTIGYNFLDDTQRIGMEYYFYESHGAHRPQKWSEDEQGYTSPQIVDRDTYNIAFTYDGKTLDNMFNWHASYQRGHDTYLNIDLPKNNNIYRQTQTIKNEQFRVNGGFNGEWVDLSLGADYSIYRGWMGVGPKTQAPGYPFGYPRHRTTTSNYLGLWTVGTLKLMDNSLNLSVGLRYEYDKMKDDFRGTEPWAHYKPDGSLNPNWNPAWQSWIDKYGEPKKNRAFDYLNPSLGVTWLPLDWLKLRASYFRGFRAPSGRQLFNDNHLDGYGMGGIPWNEPEKSDNYEAGFDLNWEKMNFAFTYFYGQQRNYMWMTPGGATGGLHAREKRIFYGFEIGASVDVAHWMGFNNFEIRPFLNMTYLPKKDELYGTRLQPNGDWAEIDGMAKMTANYGLRFRHFDWGTSVNLNFVYFGETWGTTAGQRVQYGKFTVANLSATQHLWEFENIGSVQLKLQVNNLFDKTYKYTVGLNDVNWQGRNFYGALIFNF